VLIYGRDCEFFPSPLSPDSYCVQSTDHELISARNVSLAAMQDSVSASDVRYYPT
jgi:hypothetical protein